MDEARFEPHVFLFCSFAVPSCIRVCTALILYNVYFILCPAIQLFITPTSLLTQHSRATQFLLISYSLCTMECRM